MWTILGLEGMFIKAKQKLSGLFGLAETGNLLNPLTSVEGFNAHHTAIFGKAQANTASTSLS